jgi:SAM-dependent methyltransferase
MRFMPAASLATVRDRYDAAYFAEYPGGKAYDEDEKQRRHEAARRLRWLQSHGAEGALVEIGSASGYFLDAARRGGFMPVVGVEPAAETARAAAARFGVEVIADVVEEADLGDARFDVACAWHALEHVAEPQGALQRISSSLRPGGRLFVEVPNIDSVRARRAGEDWFHLDAEHHVAHYAPRSLRALLERAGFRVELIESVAPATFLRLGKAVTPRGVAFLAREALVTRAWPLARHGWRHELLRAVARRPA